MEINTDILCLSQIQQHRITKWLRLKGICGCHRVQPPCSNRGTESRLPRTMSRSLLKISKEGDFTTSLGNLCQCFITHTVWKCFLMFRWKLSSSLCPLPLFLALGTTVKSMAASSFHPPFSYLYTWIRSPSQLLFSRLNSPSSFCLSLSVFLLTRDSCQPTSPTCPSPTG